MKLVTDIFKKLKNQDPEFYERVRSFKYRVVIRADESSNPEIKLAIESLMGVAIRKEFEDIGIPHRVILTRDGVYVESNDKDMIGYIKLKY